MKFQISPSAQMAVFASAGALLVAVSQGAIPLPMGIPEIWGQYMQSWATVAVKIWAVVGGPALMAFGNSQPGPLAPPDPPGVVAATKAAAANPKGP